MCFALSTAWQRLFTCRLVPNVSPMRVIHDRTIRTSVYLQGKHAEAIEYQKETNDFMLWSTS